MVVGCCPLCQPGLPSSDCLAVLRPAQPAPTMIPQDPNQTQTVPTGSLLHELSRLTSTADHIIQPLFGPSSFDWLAGLQPASSAQMTAHVPNQTQTVPEGSLLHELPSIIRAAVNILLPQMDAPPWTTWLSNTLRRQCLQLWMAPHVRLYSPPSFYLVGTLLTPCPTSTDSFHHP